MCAQLSFHRCLGPDNGMGCSHPGAVLAGSGSQVVRWVTGWVQKQEAGLPPAAPQLGPWGLLFVEGGGIKGLQCPLSPPTRLCELEEDKGGLSGIVSTQPNSPLIHIVGACGVGERGERKSPCTRDFLRPHRGLRQPAAAIFKILVTSVHTSTSTDFCLFHCMSEFFTPLGNTITSFQGQKEIKR